MNNQEKKSLKCIHCNKPLRKFRTSNDWDGRTLHKQCYKDRKRFLNYDEILKKFDDIIKLY